MEFILLEQQQRGDPFWPVKFGQLYYANTGKLVFTYFDTRVVTILAIPGGKRHRNRAVMISCNKCRFTLFF